MQEHVCVGIRTHAEDARARAHRLEHCMKGCLVHTRKAVWCMNGSWCMNGTLVHEWHCMGCD